jgi:hypothetical protein
VYDLGEAGGVVFLADIDADMETQRLIAPQYRPADLCKRLSIKSDTGLQHLAFEISRDTHLTLEQAVEKSKTGRAAASTFPGEYAEFIDLYLSPEVASNFEPDQVPTLDPRVSELVLRSLRISGAVTPTSENEPVSQEHNGFALEMYLPFLLDYPSRTSAWEASKPTRQLAYAVLQLIRGSNIPSVAEMRRLQSISSGLQIEVPAPTEIDGLGASLLTLLSKIERGVGKSELVWVMLAFYQDIVMTMDRARGYPLSLEVLRQEARGKLDACSWDFLHLLAQTQATYYSLRMFRQILEFSAQHTGALSATLSELVQFLSQLPSFPDFPSPTTFAKTISSVREEGGLECLESLCADYEDAILLIKSVWQPQNSKKSKKRKFVASDEGNTKPRSSNPFDLLARAEE